MTEVEARRALVITALRSVQAGLNHGTTGNLSVRLDERMLITPTGRPCDALEAPDLVMMTLDGVPEEGAPAPSSEWRLHRDIYRARPDIGAIVHAHPVFSTTIACLRQDLPAVHYMIAAAGTDTVRCATYATFGTEALSRAAVEALAAASACLLANHGLVAVGPDPAAALRVALEVESVAELYWRARQAGEPVILTAGEMAEVRHRFRTYGG